MTAANPMRGEADLGEHRLCVDFNSLCALEQRTGMDVQELLVKAESGGLGFNDLRTWIGVFLVTPMSEEQVGNLLGTVGFEPGIAALTAAMKGFFAVPEEKEARPPKAA